jgi:hypothetical protein
VNSLRFDIITPLLLHAGEPFWNNLRERAAMPPGFGGDTPLSDVRFTGSFTHAAMLIDEALPGA